MLLLTIICLLPTVYLLGGAIYWLIVEPAEWRKTERIIELDEIKRKYKQKQERMNNDRANQ